MEAPGDRRLERSGAERSQDYEPPQVERVLTPAELEQEILYAGQDNSLQT
jgi:hypothetical protein